MREAPSRYRNDIYDILNLFYGGAPRFADGDTGADTPGDEPDADLIDIYETPGGFDIRLSFADGRVAADAVILTSDNADIDSATHGIDTNMPHCGIVANANAREYKLSSGSGRNRAYELKMLLYRALKGRAAAENGGDMPSGMPRAELPWGALVGIRPVKLVAELLASGMSESEAVAAMAAKYDVSEQKTRLCAEVARAQAPQLTRYTPGADILLYVGIPFCRTKCAYCSFPSDAHNRADRYAGAYVGALLRETQCAAELVRAAGLRPRAVYIGGGTPTALAPRDLDAVLSGVYAAFPGARPDELTVEAGRADTVDREKLRVIRGAAAYAGRVRVCINPQTMNDRTLAAIGRAHTADDVRAAFWFAREEGFDEINMDVIAGLPGEGLRDFERTLGAIGELAPEGITSHTLSIKRSSRMNEFPGAYDRAGAVVTAAMQDAARAFAGRLGMEPYYLYRQKNTLGNLENIGYALPGRHCLYNIHEMADTVDVLALGAGGVSKFAGAEPGRVDRLFNVKNLLEYIARVDEMIERKRAYFAARDTARAV